MNIDIDTKFITLIGEPLGQSFSARMQNGAYEAAGINMLYFYTEAGCDKLPDIIRGIRAMPFAGCGVTKPNKVEMMQYLDGYDPLCEKMGSTNTVVKTAEGKLIGYNTDGYGAMRSLAEAVGDVYGRTVFSFGAGGTGRSVCFELADAGARRIYICARERDHYELSARINSFYPGVCVPVQFGNEGVIGDAIAETDIILNLTGCGMRGREDETPLDKKFFKPEHICFDATYNPTETRFLAEARAAGCRTINGIDMLIYQGIRQIELWTGREAPEKAMRATVRDILAGR